MTVGVKIYEAKDTVKKYENLGYRFVGEENVGEGYLKLIFRDPVVPEKNSITDIQFHEGDYVESNDGKIGYISSICHCDECKKRGFFEPTITYSDGTTDYINIINVIQEENLGNIYDIEESDSEVLFKFKYADSGKIIPLLKPRTSGANISPFSSRNLPQNKDYRIPDEDLIKYKNIIEKIPSERILTVSHATNSFIKSLANRRKPLDSIKANMKLKGLRGKEYIHSIGLWDKYIKYLEKNL